MLFISLFSFKSPLGQIILFPLGFLFEERPFSAIDWTSGSRCLYHYLKIISVGSDHFISVGLSLRGRPCSAIDWTSGSRCLCHFISVGLSLRGGPFSAIDWTSGSRCLCHFISVGLSLRGETLQCNRLDKWLTLFMSFYLRWAFSSRRDPSVQ